LLIPRRPLAEKYLHEALVPAYRISIS